MFTQEDKEIFEFESDLKGTKRYADPLVIRKRLASACKGEDMSILWRNATIQSPKDAEGNPTPMEPHAEKLMLESEQRLLDITKEAFDVKDLDAATGEGLTQKAMLRLLVSYLMWTDSVKKNIETSPS